MSDSSKKRDRIRRVSFNDDDEEIELPQHEFDHDDADSNSSADSDMDTVRANISDTSGQSLLLIYNKDSLRPSRGILKKTSNEERREAVVLEIEESHAIPKPTEVPKRKYFGFPGLAIFDFIDKHFMATEDQFKTEDDFKMTILFCKISSIWFMNLLAIISGTFLTVLAIIHMHQHIVLHNILPWLLVTILNLSVLAALWLKLPRLMNPFRLCCVIFQATCLVTILISFGFILVSSILVIFESIIPKIFECKDLVNAEKFRSASLIMVASGFFYFGTAVISNAANKSYFYLLKKELIRSTIDGS